MESFGFNNIRKNQAHSTFPCKMKILLYLLPLLFKSASPQPICGTSKVTDHHNPLSTGQSPDAGGNRRFPICWPSTDTTNQPDGVCLDILELAVVPTSYSFSVGMIVNGVLPFTCSSYWSNRWTAWPSLSTKICGNSFTYTASISAPIGTTPISTFTLNTVAQNFNLGATSLSMLGTHTITLTATAKDTANMDPLPGQTYQSSLPAQGTQIPGQYHSTFITIPLLIYDPCVGTQFITNPATLPDAFIQFGDTSFKTIATAFFDDTVGSGNAPIDGSCCYCGGRSYYFQSTNPVSPASPLTNSEILIDSTSGVITASSSTNQNTIGQHTIVIQATMTRSSLTSVPVINKVFTLEVQCVLQSMTMVAPQSKYYEVLTNFDQNQNPQASWSYSIAGIVQTPAACNRPLTVTATASASFLLASQSQSATDLVLVLGATNQRSLSSLGPYSITLSAETPPYTYTPVVPQTTQSTTMSVTVLDPCRRTALNSVSIQNLTSFERQPTVSLQTYAFSDTIQLLSGIPDYCGEKQFGFQINSLPTTELTGTNGGEIYYQPLETSKYGTFKSSLIVTLNTDTYSAGLPTFTTTQTFFVTNIGIFPTKIPNQKYTIGNDPLQIQFSAFDVIPETIDQSQWNTTHKAYWNEYNISLGVTPAVSELNQLSELPPWAVSVNLNSTSLEIVCYSVDRSVNGTYEIVVARIIHSFSDFVKISTFKVEIETVPDIIDIKKPFFTTPLQDQIIQQCPENQTSDWYYFLPQTATNSEPSQYVTSINVLYIPAFIGYDSTQSMLYQIAYQSNPINTTVTFTLTTNKGKRSTQTMKISFLCNRTGSFFAADAAKYQALLDQVSRQKTHPAAFISKIEFTGLVHISFNTSMKPPDHVIDIQNSTLVINETTYPAMRVQVVPGKYSDSHMLKFNWTLVSYTPGKLLFQLNFENPSYVSNQADPDSIQITVYGFYLFTDFRGNMMMPESKLNMKNIPLLTSAEAAAQAAQMGASVQGAITGVTLSSTLMTVLVAGPLNQILDAIKALQITSHLMLINVQQPANSQIFFGLLMSILSLQLIPTSDYFTAWFKLDEEGNQPVNDNFDNLGYSALYLIQNMGTLLLVVVAPVVWYCACFCWMHLWEGNTQKFRYDQIRNFLFFNGTFSFFNETFLIVSFCCAIATFYFRFNTPGNIFNSFLTLGFTAILIVFPVAVIIYYTRPKVLKLLLSGDQEQISKYGELMKPFNLKRRGKQVLIYLGVSLLRRLSLVLTIIFLQDKPVFSLICVHFQGLMVTITSGYTEPFVSRVSNRMDLLNETFVLLTMYQLFCFTGFVVQHEAKSVVGLILITLTCLHVAINLSVMAGCNLALVARKAKLKYLQEKQRQILNSRKKAADKKRKEEFDRKVEMILEFENQKRKNLPGQKGRQKKQKNNLSQISEASCESDSDNDEKLKKKLQFVPVKTKPLSVIDLFSPTSPLEGRAKVGAVQLPPPQPVKKRIEVFDILGNKFETETPQLFSVAQMYQNTNWEQQKPLSQPQMQSTQNYETHSLEKGMNPQYQANLNISNLFESLQSDQSNLQLEMRLKQLRDERQARTQRLEVERIQNDEPARLTNQLLNSFWDSELPDSASVQPKDSLINKTQRYQPENSASSIEAVPTKKDLWDQFNKPTLLQRPPVSMVPLKDTLYQNAKGEYFFNEMQLLL